MIGMRYQGHQHRFVVFLILWITWGCGTDRPDAGGGDEVVFELQDSPVNSPLYTYADSIQLKAALASFQLEPGLRIELIAAEPLVIDPVAFAFDENRVLYVAENRGYPDPAEGGTSTQLGRIARLEDRDGDGKYDHRTEFATGLTYPNGIMVWRGGVFVTCAPDIYYFKDTNGDGVADVKKVVLTGFNADKTAQIRASHPTLGLDGWVYVTGGLNGGSVTSPEHPDRAAVTLSSSDGRFHPDTFEFQTTGGRSQFGLAFDPFGRRFGTSNRHPLQHVVIEPWQLARNPHLTFNRTTQDVAKPEAEATVYPISNAVITADFIPKLIGLSHKGTFTSACGPVLFYGTALKPEHVGNAFICEPAQNLVQRQVLSPDEVSFRAQRAYENREFLASTDSWFNPVFLGHGPDGAMYLADMYRKVIDHPSYVPESAREGLDFVSGKDKGRIYRIVRKEFNQANPSGEQTGSLVLPFEDPVALLGSADEWERSVAHRLLLEASDTRTMSQVSDVFHKSERPESRARALWVLQSMRALDVKHLEKAFIDSNLGVREQAVILSGQLASDHPELVRPLIAATEDDEMRVRFLASLELGSLTGEEIMGALAQVAVRDGANPWSRSAVLSGIGGQLPEYLQVFRLMESADSPAFPVMMQELGALVGNSASWQDCRELLQDMLGSSGDIRWRMATLLGLLGGLEGRKIAPVDLGLASALDNTPLSDRELTSRREFVAEVVRIGLNESEAVSVRAVAVSLLGYAPFQWVELELGQLLKPHHPTEIQLAAVKAIAGVDDPGAAELLLSADAWSSFTPRVKSAVVAALVSRRATVQQLLSAIADQVVAPAEIPSMVRQRLMSDGLPAIRDKAASLFHDLEGGGRMAVFEEYLGVLENPSDPVLGKQVFEKNCSSCHTYAGQGGQVGPDLTGVKNQPGDALLLHTLVPNYEVLPAYQAISIQTKDGRTLAGWVAAESDQSITLRTAYGTDEAVLRSTIASIHHSGLSLMPDGLEQTMTKEELANLIGFLKSGGIEP
ncbi:MAG: c-type cytochrome [Lunatimonas sp.]|uniref:PVC-type heme-binding CxxCH protein n=1 Tax=Lunatimonas sp. TaxID=2060141 RepID=UPI00263AEDA7|nr:PVC-type heme-binding CxxCH protein [Lunatimonas sp.]MCC5938331.1 c-type cytochrome [Lunatimonas sp.]